MDKRKADKIIFILGEIYKDLGCGLDFGSPYELLIATILSAQCTDVRVNIVTDELFTLAGDPQSILRMGEEKLKEIIRPCGLSPSKAKNIIAASDIIAEKYKGQVPQTFEELVELPGVGRKTANVVLANAFGVSAIAVDTHVQRVSNRIGLAHSADVVKTEQMLQQIINKELWSSAHHWLIWHGRRICKARKPLCGECPLKELCEFSDKNL